jgi:TRAP-type C4-dicarboxylate transport system permease small subunit
MSVYRIRRWDSIILAVLTWAMCTGLAAEKIWTDGISSWTLMLAMPVLTAAVAVLLHQGFEDIRAFKWLRGPTALVLASLCLAVTLPASIGSSGGARDTALAEAAAANRGVEIAKEGYGDVKRDLEWAKTGVVRECVGAPAVIVDTSWPKCQWWRRQLAAHETAIGRLGKELAAAPAVKVADSGEQRVAWAVSAVASRWDFKVTAADVALVWPMLPPVAFELLAAFFLAAGLERRGTHQKVESKQADKAPPVPIETHPPVVITPVTAGEYAKVIAGPGENPTPPKKKRSKRREKKDRVIAAIRQQTLAGTRPSFKLVKARYRLPGSTTSRWMKEAAA